MLTGDGYIKSLIQKLGPKSDTQISTSGFHLEAELLLCCARVCMTTAIADRLGDLLREDINWAYVIRTAWLHGITPLLSQHLHLTYPEAVPKTILDQIQRRVHANALHNFFLTQELLKLLTLFEAHGIPAIPYKGPVLAVTAYGNLALRQFSDLDIVVHKQDILRVKALLIAQGYRPWCQLTEVQEAAHLRSFHAYTFVSVDGRVNVDVHWRFAGSHYAFPLDLEFLWERLEPLDLAGIRILTLSPEDLLLILCVHGAKEGWTHLKWICDIAEMVRVHRGMNWGRIMEQASRLHSERMLFLGLLLASRLLGAALPKDILQCVQINPVIDRLAAQVGNRIFSESTVIGQAVEKDILRFRLIASWQGKFGYVCDRLRTIVTPNTRDQALFPLPLDLSFLHYALRPIRLVRAYGPALWQLYRRRFP